MAGLVNREQLGSEAKVYWAWGGKAVKSGQG